MFEKGRKREEERVGERAGKRMKKKGATWYERVGRSRRTYRIGNAVEDIKSSSTICQSLLTGSFHLVLLFHLHFLPERRSFARDVPTRREVTRRLLTRLSPRSVSIAKRRLPLLSSPIFSVSHSLRQRANRFGPEWVRMTRRSRETGGFPKLFSGKRETKSGKRKTNAKVVSKENAKVSLGIDQSVRETKGSTAGCASGY